MVDGGLLSGVGFPAIEGWYCTQASPHVMDDASMSAWVAKYTKTYNMTPSDYAITGYDAAMVIGDAIKRVSASGKPVNRDTVRDAIHATILTTLQGPVSFDENGVWPVVENAPVVPLPPDTPVHTLSQTCDRSFSALIDSLQKTFDGNPSHLDAAVGLMYTLRLQAQELVQMPIPGMSANAGPRFLYDGKTASG